MAQLLEMSCGRCTAVFWRKGCEETDIQKCSLFPIFMAFAQCQEVGESVTVVDSTMNLNVNCPKEGCEGRLSANRPIITKYV